MGQTRLNIAQLSHLISTIATRCQSVQSLAYFDCLDLIDSLEFHVLNITSQTDEDAELKALIDTAKHLHTDLTTRTQTLMKALIQDIRAQSFASSHLQQMIADYRRSAKDKLPKNQPGYDALDSFLGQLLRVDFVPSETRPRTDEMIYLQPTPGRIILDLLEHVTLSETDTFYDFGSGLGHVSLIVSLLTHCRAVGIEYEPSYVTYANLCAQKLHCSQVTFINQDVRQASFDDGTVFFMYTPFQGSIMRQVLDRLYKLSRTKPITLCTYGACTRIIQMETWLTSQRDVVAVDYELGVFVSDHK